MAYQSQIDSLLKANSLFIFRSSHTDRQWYFSLAVRLKVFKYGGRNNQTNALRAQRTSTSRGARWMRPRELQQPIALPSAPTALGTSLTQDLQLHREDFRISRSRAASSASLVPIQYVPAFSSKVSSSERADDWLKHIANIPLSTQRHYCTPSLCLPDLSYPCYPTA